MRQLKNPGRVAGIFYIAIIVFGVFAHFGVREQIVVYDDAARTVTNIIQNETLFRMGIISDLMMVLSYFGLGITLYRLFREVDPVVSMIMLGMNLFGVAMMGLNMMNQVAALMAATDLSFINGFTREQMNGLVLMFMKIHDYGYDMATISFGPWLFPIGYIVYKGRLMPRLIGVFLMIGAIEFMFYFVIEYTLPNLYTQIASFDGLLSSIGEFSFCIWLLVFGIKSVKIQNAVKRLATV